MTAVLISLVFAVVLILLFSPAYMYICYDGDFVIFVRFLLLKFKIYPPKHKRKDAKSKKKKNSAQKVKTDGQSFLKQLENIKNIASAVKKHILKAFTIRRFKLDITVASDDPCETALLFGAVNAAAFTAAGVVDCLVSVTDRQINVTADYNEEKTSVLADIVLRTFLFKLLSGLILLTIDDTINLKK